MTTGQAHRARNEGFSLVELLVAIGFIGLGLLSLGQLFVMSVKSADVGRKDTAAMNLACEIVERMRSVPYEDMVAAFDGLDTSQPASIPAESRDWADHLSAALGPGCRGVVSVADGVENRNGLARIDVTVSWVDRADTLRLTSTVYVSKMGV